VPLERKPDFTLLAVLSAASTPVDGFPSVERAGRNALPRAHATQAVVFPPRFQHDGAAARWHDSCSMVKKPRAENKTT
jgi:hypothetical protein